MFLLLQKAFRYNCEPNYHRLMQLLIYSMIQDNSVRSLWGFWLLPGSSVLMRDVGNEMTQTVSHQHQCCGLWFNQPLPNLIKYCYPSCIVWISAVLPRSHDFCYNHERHRCLANSISKHTCVFLKYKNRLSIKIAQYSPVPGSPR